MAPPKVIPESRTCPIDGVAFEVGGRGRRDRSAIYCSVRCLNIMRARKHPHTGSHAPRPKKNRDTLHNEAWLRQKYLDERASTTDIGKFLGCSAPTVVWALRKFGIPVRSISEAKVGQPSHPWTDEQKERLRVRFSGSGGTNWGKPSGHRGPNYDPDPKVSAVQKQRAYRRGISAPDYDAMLEAQGGVCAICQAPETRRHPSGTVFTLGVDHDHVTGKIRGLLCTSCNTGIGMAHERLDVLRAMIAYLERHAA